MSSYSRNAASFNLAAATSKIDRSFWASNNRERPGERWLIEVKAEMKTHLLET
jgi:hypothetical protein